MASAEVLELDMSNESEREREKERDLDLARRGREAGPMGGNRRGAGVSPLTGWRPGAEPHAQRAWAAHSLVVPARIHTPALQRGFGSSSRRPSPHHRNNTE